MIDTTPYTQIIFETFAGIIKNSPYFILIYWSVQRIVKEVPNWISQLNTEKNEKSAIRNALNRFKR